MPDLGISRKHTSRGMLGACCAVALLAAPAAPVLAAEPEPIRATAVPGELIVQFEPGVPGSQRAAARRQAGVRAERAMLASGQQLVSVIAGGSERAALARLERDPRVEYAQPNYIRRKRETVPSDPRVGEQWALFPDRIAATLAWDRATGDAGVTIAIVDEGVAYDHVDLLSNAVVPGHDFVDDDDDPRDFSGHGTHVAGIAAAEGNNATGIAGVTWAARIMPVRVLDFGGGTDADVADGFRFAGQNGANVLNASLGGPGYSEAMFDAIADFPSTLFVVAAGNDGLDNDSSVQKPDGDYPCNFTHANLICVAATDEDDLRATFSSYGPRSVDLGAPGVNVVSTFLERTGKFDDFESSATFNADWGGPSSDWKRTSARSGGPGAFSVTDSLSGDYAPNAVATLETTDDLDALDFTGLHGCSLQLELAWDIPDDDDFVAIAISRDGGPWDDLARIWGNSDGNDPDTEPDFQPFEFDLHADGQPVRVQFRLESDNSIQGDGAYVDNVDVGCSAPDPNPEGTYRSLDGTSMAAPHVAGAAALVLSARPTLTITQLRHVLLSSGDPLPSLAGVTATGRRLDVNAALSAPADPPPPPPPLVLPQPPIAPRVGPPAPDTTAPRVSFTLTRGQTLRTLVRRGLRGLARCNEACAMRAEIVIGARTARRLGLTRGRRPIVVGRWRASLDAAGTRRAVVRITRRARARLGRARLLRFTVRVRAEDPSGNRSTLTRRARLRR